MDFDGQACYALREKNPIRCLQRKAISVIDACTHHQGLPACVGFADFRVGFDLVGFHLNG